MKFFEALRICERLGLKNALQARFTLRNTSFFYLSQSTLKSRCIAFAIILSSLPESDQERSVHATFWQLEPVSSVKSTSLQATDTAVNVNNIKILLE